MSPTLLSLAPELLCVLAEHVRIAHLTQTQETQTRKVTKKDLKQLRLTCKHLGDILESQVLHTIHFSIEHSNYSKATARLQRLATTKNLSPPRGLFRRVVTSTSGLFHPSIFLVYYVDQQVIKNLWITRRYWSRKN